MMNGQVGPIAQAHRFGIGWGGCGGGKTGNEAAQQSGETEHFVTSFQVG